MCIRDSPNAELTSWELLGHWYSRDARRVYYLNREIDVYKRQIQLSEYIKRMPLEIAVFRNDVPMIHFLLEHGADPGLAEEQPLSLIHI